MMSLPNRAEMVAALDAMLDVWRTKSGIGDLGPGSTNGRPGGVGGSGGSAMSHEAAPHPRHKPPAVYSIGIVDYPGLCEIDPGGAETLVDEAKRRLDRLVRSGDALGFVNPDSFLLATGEMEPATAGAVMDRIRGALAMPLEIGGCPVSLTVAIGVAFAFDNECGEYMVDQAERDMHRVMDH